MIDVNAVTKFDRTPDELFEFWLFSLVVAGKTAKTQARLLDDFIQSLPLPGAPIAVRIRMAKTKRKLMKLLQDSRLGQYNRLHEAFCQSINLDLETCTLHDLEDVFGVGPKTARFFLMHSRENQRFAALDVHILKHLREAGIERVPKITPSGQTYFRLEEAFLKMADEAKMSVADYDLKIWIQYSQKAA